MGVWGRFDYSLPSSFPPFTDLASSPVNCSANNSTYLNQDKQSSTCQFVSSLFQVHLHFPLKRKKTIESTRSDMLSHLEVEKHNKSDDLWVIVDGNAYDLTDVSTLRFPSGVGGSTVD